MLLGSVGMVGVRGINPSPVAPGPTGDALVWGSGFYLVWDTGNYLVWGP